MENELDGFGVSFSYGKPVELPGTGKSVIYINTDFNEDLTRKSNKRSCWRKKIILRNEFSMASCFRDLKYLNGVDCGCTKHD